MYISSKTYNASFLEVTLGRFNGYILFKKKLTKFVVMTTSKSSISVLKKKKQSC